MTISNKIILLASSAIASLFLMDILDYFTLISPSDRIIISTIFILSIMLLSYDIYQKFSKNLHIIHTKIKQLDSGHFTDIEQEDTNALDEFSPIIEGFNKSINSTKTTLWKAKGLQELNTELLSKLTLNEVTDRAINFLCTYINAGVGTLYLYDKKSELLSLSASYAYIPNKDHPNAFKLGEGLIGQVARQRSAILRRNIVSSENKIYSAFTQEKPQITYTFPLIFQGQLIGVIALGLSDVFDLAMQEFVDQGSHTIVTALSNAYQNQKISTILAESQNLNLQLNEQKLALDAHSIVGITDVKGTITYVNDKFVQISGYTKEELIGQNHRMLNSSQHDKSFWKHMYERVSHGHIWQDNNIRNLAKDGSYYWVDTTIVPFMKDGKPQSYVAIRTDVTESREIEAKLLKSNLKAQSAVKAKSEFLASMSHEIRTPMNGVIGMLTLLKNTNLDSKQAHQVNIAHSSAESLLSIVNDILDYSKLEANKVELDTTAFDLRHELSNFIEAMQVNIKQEDVSLILDMDKDRDEIVIADLGRLKQILNNLIGNAIKFTHQGEIKLHVHFKNDNTLHFEVKDSGIGISEDKLEILFDAFTQADTSTTRHYGGTGLGLSIAKKLVEVMGGELRVQSKLGEGSTFSYDIHITIADPNTPLNDSLDLRKSTLSALNPQSKILLVEDNITNQIVASGILEVLNLHTDIANNGEIALKMLKQHRYEIVFMDCQMPVLDGFDTTKSIRQGDGGHENTHVPIVAMTANAMLGDKEKCFSVGMNDYISKPINPETLNAILHKYLKEVDTPKQLHDEGKSSYPKEVWDKTSALSRVMGKEKILIKIITTFIEENRVNIAKIDDAIVHQDISTIQDVAHAIKGSSANISANTLNTVAKDLEQLAKDSDLVGIKELRPILELQTQELFDILTTYIKGDIDAHKL